MKASGRKKLGRRNKNANASGELNSKKCIFIICRWEGMYMWENPLILKIYLMIADMTSIIFIQEA